MRRWTIAALVVPALGGGAAAPSAAAAPSVLRDAALLHTVQHYGERPYRGEWGPRRHLREHRRAHEEARIAEAARGVPHPAGAHAAPGMAARAT